ncbi:MAG: hypothetical protein GC138_00855 [Gammaproteobacteria bacterium]|nr:hypothetical protein [Gammaproteobacteria bacterium]
MCLCVLIGALSGPVAGTPVIQHDPQSSYVPDSSETAMDQSALVRAMVPVDDATFWTIMLVEREEERGSARDFLLSLKKEVSRLIPDWLRNLTGNTSQTEDSEGKRANAKAIGDLSSVLDANEVPQSELLDDSRIGADRPPGAEVKPADPTPLGKNSVPRKVPLSQLFQRNSLPGMIQGGQRFTGAGGWAIQLGGPLTDTINGNPLEKSRSQQTSGRLEQITQWFHDLLAFLTGIYTYLVLGAFLLVYLLVRYLLQRPRMG